MSEAANKPMSKPLLYGIFIIKFVFGLALIVWTVMMTLSSDVGEDDDNAFLSTYHEVDDNFNQMSIDNANFRNKYNIKLELNDEIIYGLDMQDVFLAQRAIKDRTNKKDILKVGKNNFKYAIQTKDGTEVKNAKLAMLVTMATNHTYDKNLEFKTDTETFKLAKKGYWNITGTIEIGEDKGYFFIKTNAR
ncbi:MAG: hypothetical protein KAQ94_04150 [Arcobacteraceae bacterium]|nr:hypothetical protein [Arcobacteraceae bacterium]